MTAKEIREKETSHLTHELEEQKKHLFDLRSQAVTEKLEDPSQLRKVKRDIARVKTILRQRVLESQPKNVEKAPVATKTAATKTVTAKKPTKTKMTATSKK